MHCCFGCKSLGEAQQLDSASSPHTPSLQLYHSARCLSLPKLSMCAVALLSCKQAGKVAPWLCKVAVVAPLLTRGTTQRRFDVLRTAAEVSYRVLQSAACCPHTDRPCLHAPIHSKPCLESVADEDTQRWNPGRFH